MRILKILSLLLAVCLILCCCGNNAETETKPVTATESGSESNITPSEKDDSSANEGDGEEIYVEDPQPVVKEENSGTKVEATQLDKKSGKANGIDVSKWQGKIDWKRVKASGIEFAIIRIGYRAENGKIYKDECADYNIQQAVKNNILVGVYFFSTAVNKKEAKAEAEWTANTIKSYPVSYPVVYDCEGYENTDSRMHSLTKEQRTDNAISFLSTIEQKGYSGMFYAALGDIKNSVNWDMTRLESSYKIWVAHYPSVTYPKVLNPDYDGKYDMWQYTHKGEVDGIKGDTDMVVSYFTVKKAAAKSNEKAPEATEPKEKDNVYTLVNDTVTAKEVVNLRESASTGAKIVGKLKNGETLKRIAKGINGWSRLLYNGKTVYAVTSYLTTDLSYKPPVPETDDGGFKKVNEKVTAKSETNLRSVPSSADPSTVVYTLKNGETATRTGVSDSGWSRLLWNGKTVYAVTSYLTTDLSYKEPVESNTSDSGIKTQFKNVNEQVTAKSETNLRTLPSVTDSEVVYTLKNGEYITRTGVSTNGWSRLLYNGKTVYAVSSYLTK